MRRDVVIILALSIACKSAPRGLAYGSADDVDAILKSGGVSGKKLSCVNPNYDGAVTRGVTCLTDLSAADVTSLTAKIGLGKSAPLLNGGNHDTCETSPNLGSSNPDVDVLGGKNTAVKNGASRIEIHVNRTTRAACVQIEYPWG